MLDKIYYFVKSVNQIQRSIHEIISNILGELSIPQETIKAIARVMFPDIQKFFESEDGKKKYEAYLTQKRSEELSDCKNK